MHASTCAMIFDFSYIEQCVAWLRQSHSDVYGDNHLVSGKVYFSSTHVHLGKPLVFYGTCILLVS